MFRPIHYPFAIDRVATMIEDELLLSKQIATRSDVPKPYHLTPALAASCLDGCLGGSERRSKLYAGDDPCDCGDGVPCGLFSTTSMVR